MSVFYWIAGAVLLVLLALAFRRKLVADEVASFLSRGDAQDYLKKQDAAGFDCFVKEKYGDVIEVRCYRRKERES